MRRAVVTGASSGIGRAVAERLLADGFAVVGLDRAPASIRHDYFEGFRVDLVDAEARATAARRLSGADVLVHCAGVMRGAALGALVAEVGAAMWQLHVEAIEDLANRLAPTMPAGGRIVLIGSRVARGEASKSQYAATKAALVALARSWAKELAPRGVTANVVAPGAVDTPMLSDPGRADVRRAPLAPIGRLIQPEEVASLVAWLASTEAGAVTGQEIIMCGGASL